MSFEKSTETYCGDTYVLNSRKSLVVMRETDLYEIIRDVNAATKRSYIYQKTFVSSTKECIKEVPLREIQVEKIKPLRKSGKPGIVIKDNGKYYYAEIDPEIKMVPEDMLGPHMCAQLCHRLSPASDEKGGCAKVRGHSFFIERFDFIKLGYETFNVPTESFIVSKCSNYYNKTRDMVLLPTKKKRPYVR